jgi:hypothetical protein
LLANTLETHKSEIQKYWNDSIHTAQANQASQANQANQAKRSILPSLPPSCLPIKGIFQYFVKLVIGFFDF